MLFVFGIGFITAKAQRVRREQAVLAALLVSIYGSALCYKKQYSEAIPALEEAMQLYPNSQTLLRLGESYEKTGNDSGAIEAWKTASCMKPSLFAPHYHLAKLYFRQMDCERAKEEANIVLTKKAKTGHPAIARMKQEMQAIWECDSTINRIKRVY